MTAFDTFELLAVCGMVFFTAVSAMLERGARRRDPPIDVTPLLPEARARRRR